MKGSFTVLIEGRPAVRKGDMVIEAAAVPPTDYSFNKIEAGCSTVKIGDLGFGLMSPDSLRAFCAAWTRLRNDWDGLDPAERALYPDWEQDTATLVAAGVTLVLGWWTCPRLVRMLPAGNRFRVQVENELGPFWQDKRLLLEVSVVSLCQRVNGPPLSETNTS